MNLEMFESTALDKSSVSLNVKLQALRGSFKSSLEPNYDTYLDMPDSVDTNVSNWLGLDSTEASAQLAAIRSTVMDAAKQMYNGVELENGKKTLGLDEISKWKKNENYEAQNIKQHSGYAAEVIGTTKENLKAKADGTGTQTFRADDRPDLFKRNDPYVDKIRVDASGEIVERIQVKFVGSNPEECLAKLTSKKYDKYFNDGMVDKMEVPKNYYDEIKNMIPDKIDDLEKQLERVKEEGKLDVAEKKEAQIERYKKIDQMLEKSTVTSEEAQEAVKHPKRYTAKLFAKNTFAESHKAGMDSAAIAVTITAAVSTVDNVSKVIEGEMTAQEAFVDVAKDTGVAGGVAYGTAFVSTAVAQTMSASSHELIKSLGNAGVPAAMISFGVESYDSIVDYASGVIDGQQLAYDLGENASSVAGSMAGAALAGAALGSVVPGAGTVAGFAAGMVGGMVGCALASEAYVSAVEFGSEHAGALAAKAQEMASKTVEIAKDLMPHKASGVAQSVNEFAKTYGLPINVQDMV